MTASSKFCSQCGWAIDPDDLHGLAVQAATDVAEGQRMFGEGRVTDALALASTVLLTDPDNVPALALKGDCLERAGDIEGALEAYEHVVTLKPESPLDRIRVAQLRRIASVPPDLVEDRPDRRNSILAAAAAFILLSSAGSALYLANRKDKVVTEAPKVETVAKSVPFLMPAPVPTQGSGTPSRPNPADGPANDQPVDNGAGNQQPQSGAGRSTVAQGRRTGDRLGLGLGSNQLPDVNSGYEPVSPYVMPNQDPPTKVADANSDPDPTPVQGNEAAKPESGGRQPVIDIHPSQQGGKTEGGSQPKESSVNEGTALIRVARQYFLAGEYDKAAKAYEKAIKLGASTASANHRLAQCYINLRKRPEALAAYQKALAAYQRMLNDGVGDKKLVESYMDECRQAIKLLQ